MDANVEQAIATAQLTTELMGQGQSALSLYVTIISGYLLVAYFIGKELTAMQCTIVTVLFLAFAALNVFAVVSYFDGAVHFGHTYGLGRAPTWTATATWPVLVFGILASLKFMWDVRHSK